MSPDEFLDSCCRYGCQGFGFYPFGEVVNGNHCIFYLTLALRHWANQVQSPLCERPRTHDRRERFSRDMWDVTEALAFVTLLHQCIGVLMHGWPKVSLPKDFVGERSGPGMVATYTVMNFPKDVVPLLCRKTFEIWGGVATLVEHIVDDSVSCRSVSQLSGLGFILRKGAVRQI
ncbi:hypothetical protein L3X38_018134 [Prunus dulcis]|uniref:Uncharacterized protein n=1 Tax=Prunus dulcis TaxID=3755 RepID=A0AAD4WAF3_PRUDU|nr:hypothetical protein L3X38_018134 [Prunus dulcis]